MKISNPREYLNGIGNIVTKCLEDLFVNRQGIHLMNFVIMPDNVQLLFELDNDENAIPITNLVGEFKRQASMRLRKRITAEKIWQRSFFDRIIRNDQEYQKIYDYIESNPVNLEEDQESLIFQ